MEHTPASPPCSAGNSPAPYSSAALDRPETDRSQQESGKRSTSPTNLQAQTFFPTPSSSVLNQPITSQASLSNLGPPAAMDPDEEPREDSDYPDSITSSVMNHVVEGGLTYHAYKDGKYAFPNNQAEQHRLDMKHHLWAMILDEPLFHAPVDPVLRAGGLVFDLGVGTGEWCIELGDMYPESTIRGIDLSPIQPTMLPPNVRFFVHDFEDDWPGREDHYDFIHIRDTMHSVHDRGALLQRIFKHLKPGGYVEIQEIDFQIYSDDGTYTPGQPNALAEFCHHLKQGLTALGIPQHPNTQTPEDLAAAGFIDISRDSPKKCPIGAWPRDKDMKQRGLLAQMIVMEGLKHLAQRPFGARGLGWTKEQIELFLVGVRQAIMDTSVHAYTLFHVVYARKPLFGTASGG